MHNFSFKRLTAWMLTLLMLFSVVPVNVSAAAMDRFLGDITSYFLSRGEVMSAVGANISAMTAAEVSASYAIDPQASDTIYILAGGDFQEAGDHAKSAENVTDILTQIKQKYTNMDGFLFIGDYDCETHNDATETADGITALMGAVQDSYSNLNDANSVLVQGNHDYMDSRIDATGGHEFDGYAAYVLNEDDYANGGGSQSGVQTLANNLKNWLETKIEESYSAPIFIVSHLPLAFTPRTVTQGDAKYAKYIFDVLNEAGESGLNIIFLHGHDHAYGPDNYMGGEAIFLAEGDKINIAKAGSQSEWTEETLKFSYMNAGYVGYYSDAYTYNATAGTDKLTMTVFAITDNEVTVERYSKDGLYTLKSAGRDGSYSDTSVTASSLRLEINETVYASPRTIDLTTVSSGTESGTNGDYVGVTPENPGIVDEWIYAGTSQTTYRYVLDTDGYETGSNNRYLFIASNAAFAMDEDGSGVVPVTFNDDETEAIVDSRDYEWYITTYRSGKTTYYPITKNGSTWIYHENYVMNVGTNNNGYWSINENDQDDGLYRFSNVDGSTWYLYYDSADRRMEVSTSNSNRVRLYKYGGEIDGGVVYVKIEGDSVYTVNMGKSSTSALNTVKAGITGYISNNAGGSGAAELADSDLTWTWLNKYNGMTEGSYRVEISYNGTVLGTVEVIVEPGMVNNYPEYPDEGAVKVSKTATGIDFQSSGIAQVEVSASGVPVKKGADVIVMLDTSSSMTSHTVTGTSKTRAEVLEESLEELIEQFKTPGADGELLDIRVAIADFNGFYGENQSKSGTAYDRDAADTMSDDIYYNAASEAQVYTGDGTLGAGAFIDAADLDNSYTLNYTSGTNYDYAMDAIYQLGTAVKEANENEERDLYVIFMSDGAAMQWNYYHSQGASSRWNNWITGAWDEDNLTTANLNCTKHAYYYDEVDHNGDGMANEHRMANAIKGDPVEYYEVIRKNNDFGTPTEEDNMYTVPGLGATMFSISFDAQADDQVTEESMDKSIETLASEQTGTTQYYYKVTSAGELDNAFTAIGSEIAYAASKARFVDQMGGSFNLQMSTSEYEVVKDGTTTTNSISPKIEIISYDIYTRQDYLNGTIAEDKIGDRKGTYTIQETVTFNKNGTEAYSDKLDGNILIDGVICAQTFWYNTTETEKEIEGVDIPTGTTAANLTTGSTNVLLSETFYWKLGTVQTSELAMRYYVYLEGSMDGLKEAGSYATNEYATLYYDNYLDNPSYKDTVSPTVAWEEANVSYAFYLVNENGEIIVNQTTGQTGSFANKIAVTNPVVYDTILLNNLENIRSIEVASDEEGVLPTGYTLYDSSAVYTIIINSNSTGSWKIEMGEDKVASTYVTQYKINDSSAYSNELTNDTVSDDYTHTVVWFAVLWKIQALPDSVVIDYGLPVDISVLTNDMFGEKGKLAAVGAYSNSLNLEGYEINLADGFGNIYKGNYGTAKADTTTGKVRYTLETMSMDGYEKFAYAVYYTGTTNPGYYYDTITVIPATTIYYEEQFVTFTNGYAVDVNADGTVSSFPEKTESNQVSEDSEYGAWSTVTDDNYSYNDNGQLVDKAGEAVTQEEDRPGRYSLSTIDANYLYGYDGVNNAITKYSLGTARQVTVGKVFNEDASGNYTTTGYNGYGPKATFTFKGTGFDIVSLTDSDSGMIMVTVRDVDGDEVDSWMITNYYGMSYEVVGEDEDGNDVYGFVPVEKAEGQDTIWQVPVIKKSGLAYGEYTVEIQVGYMSFFDQDNGGKGNNEYYFVLDAIRIYDPAGDGKIANGDGTTDTTINDAYIADGEAYPYYLMVKEAILGAEELENLSSDIEGTLNGSVFIDGMKFSQESGEGKYEGTDDAMLYSNPGPNNEAYLAPGQSISFSLTANDEPVDVQLGAKLAYGESVDVKLTYTVNDESTEKILPIGTTTDMYY